jgi:hypothetical protein
MAMAALALSAGSSLIGARQQRAAGEIAAGESKVQARQTELAATAREVDRKERLASSLASLNASAGARGIAAFEGSPLTILEADIKREERATERDIFSTQLEASALRARGSLAKKSARAQSFMGLLSSGSQFAQLAQPSKGSGGSGSTGGNVSGATF